MKISWRDYPRIKKLYEDGYRAKQIAEIYDVNVSTALKHLKVLKNTDLECIAIKPKPKTKPVSGKRMEHHREKVLQLIDDGFTIQQIVHEFDFNIGTVQRYINKLRKEEPTRVPPKLHGGFTQSKRNELHQLIEEKELNYAALMKHFNISRHMFDTEVKFLKACDPLLETEHIYIKTLEQSQPVRGKLDRDSICEDYKNGMTILELVDKHDTYYSIMANVINDLSKEGRLIKRSRGPKAKNRPDVNVHLRGETILEDIKKRINNT